MSGLVYSVVNSEVALVGSAAACMFEIIRDVAIEGTVGNQL